MERQSRDVAVPGGEARYLEGKNVCSNLVSYSAPPPWGGSAVGEGELPLPHHTSDMIGLI